MSLPIAANVKIRLVKSPKIYIRDSGILHALLGIEDYVQLLSHPSGGESLDRGETILTKVFIARKQS